MNIYFKEEEEEPGLRGRPPGQTNQARAGGSGGKGGRGGRDVVPCGSLAGIYTVMQLQ